MVQLISSQIDADRMDYLLRDAYYMPASPTALSDLTRILRVIRPFENGIVFDFSGVHAIEDYIVSRLINVYAVSLASKFVSCGMEMVL